MTGAELLDTMEAKMQREIRRMRVALESQGDPYAKYHDWLQQFAIGHGFDIACGNYPTMLADESGPVPGIDERDVVGSVLGGFVESARKLMAVDSDSCDFIISNHLEGLPHLVETLNNWYRVLKPGGVMAVMTLDAEADRFKEGSAFKSRYAKDRGPLGNPRVLNAFTKTILHQYLARCGLQRITIEVDDDLLLANGVKV